MRGCSVATCRVWRIVYGKLAIGRGGDDNQIDRLQGNDQHGECCAITHASIAHAAANAVLQCPNTVAATWAAKGKDAAYAGGETERRECRRRKFAAASPAGGDGAFATERPIVA